MFPGHDWSSSAIDPPTAVIVHLSSPKVISKLVSIALQDARVGFQNDLSSIEHLNIDDAEEERRKSNYSTVCHYITGHISQPCHHRKLTKAASACKCKWFRLDKRKRGRRERETLKINDVEPEEPQSGALHLQISVFWKDQAIDGNPNFSRSWRMSWTHGYSVAIYESQWCSQPQTLEPGYSNSHPWPEVKWPWWTRPSSLLLNLPNLWGGSDNFSFPYKYLWHG